MSNPWMIPCLHCSIETGIRTIVKCTVCGDPGCPLCTVKNPRAQPGPNDDWYPVTSNRGTRYRHSHCNPSNLQHEEAGTMEVRDERTIEIRLSREQTADAVRQWIRGQALLSDRQLDMLSKSSIEFKVTRGILSTVIKGTEDLTQEETTIEQEAQSASDALVKRGVSRHPCGGCAYLNWVAADTQSDHKSGWGCDRRGDHARERCSFFTPMDGIFKGKFPLVLDGIRCCGIRDCNEPATHHWTVRCSNEHWHSGEGYFCAKHSGTMAMPALGLCCSVVITSLVAVKARNRTSNTYPGHEGTEESP